MDGRRQKLQAQGKVIFSGPVLHTHRFFMSVNLYSLSQEIVLVIVI